MSTTTADTHFRGALGAFATGVTIVTTKDSAGHDVGLTANSFNSVSLDPPMVLWSLAKTSANLQAFKTNPHFAVHVLSAGQQALSDLFAKRGADKFSGLLVGRGLGGVALLDGCSARFQCKTAFQYDGGDHVIFVGAVNEFDHSDLEPLVFHGGKYAEVRPRLPAIETTNDEVESSFRKDFLGYLLGFASARLQAPVLTRCAELGLSEEEYYVLTILVANPDSSVAQIDKMLALTGSYLSDERMSILAAKDLIEFRHDGATRTLHLTEKGREASIKIYVVAKAAEATAEMALDFDETMLLKQMLRRIIAKMLEHDSNA